jgi:hypothetical protein
MQDDLNHLKQFEIPSPKWWANVTPKDVAGLYLIPGPKKHKLVVIFTSAYNDPWEHASISTYRKKRTPAWEEMCFIKNLFWKKDEMCIQYHPTENDYVNCHSYTLHIWRHKNIEIPKPPAEMVGPKKFKIIERKL